MNNFSNMDGTTPVSPISTGVWKIEKKRKADDERDRKSKKRKNSREREKEEKDFKVTFTGEAVKKQGNRQDDDSKKQTDYVTEKKTQKRSKIDLKI